MLSCGCLNKMACFHGPCAVIRKMTRVTTILIKNKQGNVRVAEPEELTPLPDGQVKLK